MQALFLNGTQIEGEAPVALRPLRAHARRKPLPDPRRGHAHDLSRRRVVAMVVDGAAGEASHGEERAVVLFHAERTRSRAAPRLLGLGLPLPLSLSSSASKSRDPRGNPWLVGAGGGRGSPILACARSHGRIDHEGSVPTPRRAAVLPPLVLAGSFGWQLGVS